MKNKILTSLPLASTMLVGVFAYAVRVPVKVVNAKGEEGYDTSDLATTINLNDNSETEIRNYYSSLLSLSASERQGSNLLKNLKPILKNGQKYYSYDTDSSGAKIWKMYEITDRDWEKSPAGSDEYGDYDPITNTISNYQYGSSKDNPKNNPYLHALYVNRTVENEMRAWLYDGKVSHGNNGFWCIDREHLWQKSQGFEQETKGGARGDPMHLWAGDSYVNSALHNDQFYGYVDFEQSYVDGANKWLYTGGNYQGYSLTMGDTGKVEKIFEPQDSDKGDIARALFYMVARYNFLSGEDEDGVTAYNPNLEIVQDSQKTNAYVSDETNTGKIGILTDLLAWHHLDPVDEFEIHRNNLLFNNYTNNRNPFIDFPEWVDYIWGTVTYDGRQYQSYSTTPTGYANPSTDTVNGYNEGEVIPVTGVSLSEKSVSILKNGSSILTATVEPNNATNKGVTWSSSNTSVATVSNGMVTAANYGEAIITVTTNDGAFTDTCSVKVIPSSISATANKTYFVGETISKDDIVVTTNDNVELSDFNFANDGYQFKYEDASSGGALTNKTFANAIDYNGVKCSLTVLVQRKQHKTTMSDTLDKAFTGSPGINSYKDWTGSGTNSDVVYSGKSAGGNNSIQLTNSGTAGIVTTTSEGLVTSVEVTWGTAPASGRSLKVYGKNTAYSSPSDLSNSSLQGTLIGTIDASNTSVTIKSDYLYVGVCANGGAIYMSSIIFSYVAKQTASNVSNYIMFEDTNGQCTTKTDIAIGYYDEMSDSEKEVFNTSEDYVISKGRERFTAWLKNQGKEIDSTTYKISKVNVFDSNYGNFDSNSSIIFILIASVSSLTLLAVLIIKKRKLRK